MVFSALTFLYKKLGRFYPATYLTLELQSAFGVTVGTIALLSIYYEAVARDFLVIGAVAVLTTALAIVVNLVRAYPRLRPISRWIGGRRSAAETREAWSAAVGLPLELVRRDIWVPIAIVVVPTAAAAIFVTDLPWLSFFPIFFASLVAVSYGGLLHYLLLETGMRPVLLEINHVLSPGMHGHVAAIPLRVKLMATLPLLTVITAFVVDALATEGPGTGPAFELDFFVALAVATLIALELTVMLSRSILRPISDLQKATRRIAEGRYDVSVPVTTADEIGELAASFNDMAAGLAERERIREAFGTYLDKEVADYILSEEFPEEGVELDVSVIFCDVVDFTSFAARADAREVVACLNRLFEVVVPIVYRHGGHVDKFEGDGLIAVFGAPERLSDHADRAVRAALEMIERVNGSGAVTGNGSPGAQADGAPTEGEVEFRIGVGVNSGRVVAGAIGGGGRLNFSVIGEPVNVAARVETVTRATEDDVLVTEETARRLSPEIELLDRGEVELKGIAQPVHLFTPAGVPRDGRPQPSPVPGTLARSSSSEPARGLRRFF